MEELVLVLIALILVMALVLAVMRGRAAAHRAGGRKPRGASGARRATVSRSTGYHLAPKNPDVMAGMLFELLATRLNFSEMMAFAELVVSQQTTERYLERLAAGSNSEFASQVAFLCRAIEAHAYSDTDRVRVSEAIAARARKERKLLEIQKNLDKIF